MLLLSNCVLRCTQRQRHRFISENYLFIYSVITFAGMSPRERRKKLSLQSTRGLATVFTELVPLFARHALDIIFSGHSLFSLATASALTKYFRSLPFILILLIDHSSPHHGSIRKDESERHSIFQS